MGIDIRLPNISGQTDHEKLTQIQRYLYQMAEQLQWALGNLDTATGTMVMSTSARYAGGTVADGSSQGAKANFNEIKSLIIKSADIVNAYYEVINRRLAGRYMAISDFGTFEEETEQNITENAQEIERAFSNIQEISGTLEELEYGLIEVNAHVKTGLLYTDEAGVPIYGVEVGQRNVIDGVEKFSKYARFTSDRLSFYDSNDVEVAYISDHKLYIGHAEITGTLTLGGFQIETARGFRLKYIGR